MKLEAGIYKDCAITATVKDVLANVIHRVDLFTGADTQKLKDIKALNEMKAKRNIKKGVIKHLYQVTVDAMTEAYNAQYGTKL